MLAYRGLLLAANFDQVKKFCALTIIGIFVFILFYAHKRGKPPGGFSILMMKIVHTDAASVCEMPPTFAVAGQSQYGGGCHCPLCPELKKKKKLTRTKRTKRTKIG